MFIMKNSFILFLLVFLLDLYSSTNYNFQFVILIKYEMVTNVISYFPYLHKESIRHIMALRECEYF